MPDDRHLQKELFLELQGKMRNKCGSKNFMLDKGAGFFGFFLLLVSGLLT